MEKDDLLPCRELAPESRTVRLRASSLGAGADSSLCSGARAQCPAGFDHPVQPRERERIEKSQTPGHASLVEGEIEGGVLAVMRTLPTKTKEETVLL